jgi:hypothetical protein
VGVDAFETNKKRQKTCLYITYYRHDGELRLGVNETEIWSPVGVSRLTPRAVEYGSSRVEILFLVDSPRLAPPVEIMGIEEKGESQF